MDRPTWRLTQELGGEEVLHRILKDFYDKVFDDVMIGFFFLPHDKAKLIEHQKAYLMANLGEVEGRYEGKPMRRAHEHLPILGAHFDRRHQILVETLKAHDVSEHVQEAWLRFEQQLKPLIVRTGGKARDEILGK